MGDIVMTVYNAQESSVKFHRMETLGPTLLAWKIETSLLCAVFEGNIAYSYKIPGQL